MEVSLLSVNSRLRTVLFAGSLLTTLKASLHDGQSLMSLWHPRIRPMFRQILVSRLESSETSISQQKDLQPINLYYSSSKGRKLQISLVSNSGRYWTVEIKINTKLFQYSHLRKLYKDKKSILKQ